MKKVLIVDDSLFMRKVLTALIPPGHEVIEADSGPAALLQFSKERPDLVFLDIVMAGGEDEGVKVLREIMSADPQAQVVMITAVGQDAIMAECAKLGAKDYIVKPFDDEQVRSTVEKCLGQTVAAARGER